MNVPGTEERADPAWAPVLGAAYALFAVSAALFLAAGFTQVDALVASIGSIAPAPDRIGRFVGFTVIGALGLMVAVPLAKRQMHTMPTSSVGPRIVAVAVTALVMMAPPVQWVMFGRPDPMAGHQQHDMPEAQPSTDGAHDDGHEHADH